MIYCAPLFNFNLPSNFSSVSKIASLTYKKVIFLLRKGLDRLELTFILLTPRGLVFLLVSFPVSIKRGI